MAIERLIIRPEQMRALGLSFADQTRVQLEDHCWFTYPDLCEELGEAEVTRLVKVGIELAKESGYETYTDTLSLVEALLHANPAQLVWGSDWPHPAIAPPMVDDGDLMQALLDACSDAELQQVLVDNPSRLYWSH